MKQVKRRREKQVRRERLPVPELKREAQRLIAAGKMPSLAELLRAMRETKRELTIPVTGTVQ